MPEPNAGNPFGTALDRNNAIVFARRTLQNLEHLEHSAAHGSDVHVITQLGNSLLGLLVFPYEQCLRGADNTKPLSELDNEGWPTWQVTLGKAATLGDLSRHLRNAVAHGRLRFTSDSRELAEVTLVAEDGPGKGPVNWRASISGPDLRDFCVRYLRRIVDTLD